jgi:hypothetical protein
MFRRTLLLTATLAFTPVLRAADPLTLEIPGDPDGPGKGKHVVLLSGDEEYRSEEALPMLADVLGKHGFKCTVLFSVNKDGQIDPNNGGSLSGSAALDSADAIIMALRFRHWDDEAMERFDKAFKRGVPIVALRTSTHPFNFGGDSKWKSYTWNNKEGGFGKKVLGETWVSHWGHHGPEGTRGVIEPSAKDHPVLRGVKEVIGDTDVYEAYPPADATILLRGEVIIGAASDSKPADYKKKNREGKEQGVNDPMMPVAWTREYKNEAGTTNRILTTTLGAASDFKSEGLRRLVANGVLWGLNIDVPADLDVAPTGEYSPTKFGFNGAKKGIKPADTALKPAK